MKWMKHGAVDIEVRFTHLFTQKPRMVDWMGSAHQGNISEQVGHRSTNSLCTVLRNGLNVGDQLQSALDLLYVRLIFCIKSHLVFDRLVGVNNSRVIASTEMKSNGFQG